MKHHFIISYEGNKREEVEQIYEHLDLTGVETICEPYAGTAALSFYIAKKHPRRFKYVINDICPKLVKLWRILEDPHKLNVLKLHVELIAAHMIRMDTRAQQKEHYDHFKGYGRSDINVHYVLSKYKQFQRGTFPKEKITKIKPYNLHCVEFLRNEDVSITSVNALDLINGRGHEPALFMFLDPPYMMLNNDEYRNGSAKSFDVFPFLYDNPTAIKNGALVVQYYWIMRAAFRDFKLTLYSKQYSKTKKTVKHALISLTDAITTQPP